VNKITAAILALCLFAGPSLFSQDPSAPAQAENAAARPSRKGQKMAPYISGFFKDEAEVWTSPFHLDLKGVLVAGTVLATTALLVANDEGIYENVKSYQGRNPWVDKVSPVVTQLGDWGVNCGIAGLFFLGGVIARDEKARDTGLMAWETLLHTGFLVQVVKHLSGRQRPSVDNGRDHWYGPSAFFKRYSEGNFSSYDSFFSGHSVSAWGLATVIAENYGNHGWVPPVCYGLAALVGLSRLTEGAHWFSDVFLGAVVGFAVGKMVVRNQHKRLQFAPALVSGGAGLSFSYEFQAE
jgi:membrane-associated phospholipid phosphatase